MWGLLNAATAPIKSAAVQFARNQAAAATRKAGLNTLRAYRRSPVGSPEELAAVRKLTANLPALQGLAAGSGGLTAIGVSNLTGFTGQLEGALNQVGPAVDRFFGQITPQAIQKFGREQEKKGWGGALELASPLGFLAAPFIPNTPAAKPRMPGLPDDYKQTELAAGAAAEAFRPGAGFPGQQAAADRAYEAEKSRVAQLTAQDPELKRYADARKLAVAPGATPEQVQSAEDIGMQIWQQKYGNTPMGQPGGAVGRFNPLMDRTFGYQSGMSPQEMQAMQATAAPVQVAPGAVPYQKGDLGTRATLETGYDPAAYGLTPEKIEEMKQKLLQQAK